MRSECYFCFIKTVENLIDKLQPEDKAAEEFIYSVHELLYRNREIPIPHLASKLYRIVDRNFNSSNIYGEEKFQANEILLAQYDYWKKVVRESVDPFKSAIKLAVIGNIIDYGAHTVEENITGQIKSLLNRELVIDKSDELRKEFDHATSILYLGDNAGEIVFDKLFIETTGHPNVTYVVRDRPVINDVTMSDTGQCRMDEICMVISNGSDAPSTLLECCSDEFLNAFLKADLIISKGQGNFESLKDEGHHNIFFLLMAKCGPIAGLLGVNKGDLVIID